MRHIITKHFHLDKKKEKDYRNFKNELQDFHILKNMRPLREYDMADVIDYKIFGDDMQVVEIELDHGEGVRAEAGAMMYMDNGIDIQTTPGGGVFKGFKQIITGESFFITTFLYKGQGKGHVAFSAPYPGKILPLDLSGGSILCQKDAFLCAAKGIEIEVAFRKKFAKRLS